MVHCFTINNLNIVLDVTSGAVHLPDAAAFGAIKAIDQSIKSEGGITDHIRSQYSTEILAEIEELIAQKLLFSELEEEERAKEMSFAEEVLGEEAIVKALCLHIAHDCNLRCKYCFAGGGSYGEITRGKMPLEVGKRAIDFLIARSGKRRNLEIDFFGGEPTLNFEVVKQIVAYAREQEKAYGKNFRFTLTTNGLLLDDEKISYIRENIDNVVLSLDGRKETNDKMRGECYEKIVPRFKQMAKALGGKNYYIRGTYTNQNLDFCQDVLHIAELGFSQISVEPVVAPPDADYALSFEHVEALCEEYEKLAALMAKAPTEGKFNFFHFMLDLEKSPCAAKRITGCGAGAEYLAVTPEGDLYPCHQFADNAEFKLGNLFDSFDQMDFSAKKEHPWREAFSKCNVYTKPECDACWAKYYCSGGCAANAYHTNNDIMKPDEIGCLLQKKRVECAVYLGVVR